MIGGDEFGVSREPEASKDHRRISNGQTILHGKWHLGDAGGYRKARIGQLTGTSEG